MIVSFEDARPLEGNLKAFYGLRLRDLQLLWAVPSPLKTTEGGLTPFGEDVIREMNRLGMIIDLSHRGKRTSLRALEISRKPVIISHCSAADLHSVKGMGTDELDDETIRALAHNGGVMCLHFVQGYIRPHHGPVRASSN